MKMKVLLNVMIKFNMVYWWKSIWCCSIVCAILLTDNINISSTSGQYCLWSNLSKNQSKISASKLKGWNLLWKGTNISLFCKHQKDLILFLSKEGNLVHCNNVESLTEALDQPHDTNKWCLFIRNSKLSFKAVLLHTENKYSSVSKANAVHMKESYDNMHLVNVRFLGCNAVWTCRINTNILEKHIVSIYSPEDGDNMFLWTIGTYLQVPTVLQPRRPTLTSSPAWKPKISICASLWNISIMAYLWTWNWLHFCLVYNWAVYTELCCFLCETDRQAWETHYSKKQWPLKRHWFQDKKKSHQVTSS
jgi:hypothetical protein